ncbi:hypothetical protein FKM82_025740 [Ascaphus truei]
MGDLVTGVLELIKGIAGITDLIGEIPCKTEILVKVIGITDRTDRSKLGKVASITEDLAAAKLNSAAAGELLTTVRRDCRFTKSGIKGVSNLKA